MKEYEKVYKTEFDPPHENRAKQKSCALYPLRLFGIEKIIFTTRVVIIGGKNMGGGGRPRGGPMEGPMEGWTERPTARRRDEWLSVATAFIVENIVVA